MANVIHIKLVELEYNDTYRLLRPPEITTTMVTGKKGHQRQSGVSVIQRHTASYSVIQEVSGETANNNYDKYLYRY